MGSGKSTIGWYLSKELNLSFFEMDLEIEKRAEKSISEIFATSGEDKFRELEKEMLKDALEYGGVIATGGGILTNVDNRNILESEEIVVYLKGSIDSLLKNINSDKTNRRPLAENAKKQELADLLASREIYYESVADMIIDINNHKIEEILLEIMKELEERF